MMCSFPPSFCNNKQVCMFFVCMLCPPFRHALLLMIEMRVCVPVGLSALFACHPCRPTSRPLHLCPVPRPGRLSRLSCSSARASLTAVLCLGPGVSHGCPVPRPGRLSRLAGAGRRLTSDSEPAARMAPDAALRGAWGSPGRTTGWPH